MCAKSVCEREGLRGNLPCWPLGQPVCITTAGFTDPACRMGCSVSWALTILFPMQQRHFYSCRAARLQNCSLQARGLSLRHL